MGRGSKILRLSLAKSAAVVDSEAVSEGNGEDSAAVLPSATGGDSASDDHVSPSVSGDDDNLSDVFEFPLKFCNQPNTGTISTAVDAASNEDQGSIDVASESDSLVAGNCEMSGTARKVVINTAVSSKKNSKNRKLPCFFCGQFVFHMSRHLSRKHSQEPPVAAALAKPPPSKQLALQRIHNDGIYKHNVDVLRKNDGILIVGRAPAKRHSVDDFLPCHFCLQFYVKRELYRHCHECKFRETSASVESPQIAGRSLLYGSLADGGENSLLRNVFNRMRDDKLTAVVRGDRMIVEYGTMLLKKLGDKRSLDISARMRELGRLILRLRQTDDKATLDSYITARGFDNILRAIEDECKPTVGPGGRRVFERPGFVIRVGSSLFKCSQLKRGKAVREDNTIAAKEAEEYAALHKSEYTDRMASAAHASYRISGNTLNEFPDEDDLRLLRDYQQEKIAHLVHDLKTDPDEVAWRELAEITMTRLIVFNARRGSEAAELTVNDCTHPTSKVDPVVVESLSDVEKQLVQRLMVVEVIGKRNRPVPILLTEDVTKAMNELRDPQIREKCGIDVANQFLFALPNTKRGHLSFYKTLRSVARRAKLKKPHLLTTTRIRKHLATMAQVRVQYLMCRLALLAVESCIHLSIHLADLKKCDMLCNT